MAILGNWLEKRIDLSTIDNEIKSELEERLSTKALAFYIASSYVAETLGKCEIKHYVNGVETKDEWYYLFNISPNLNENATQLKTSAIHKALFCGEALIFENKGSLYLADNFIREQRPLKGDMFTNITLENETRSFTRKAEDVFYINFDDGLLKTLVDGMLVDFAEMMKYSFDTFKSSNGEKYRLVLDEIKAGDKDFATKFENVIKKQLENFINNRKAVYIQFKGQRLEQMTEPQGTTDSTDIRNLRKEIFEVTAEAFKMPVSMMYGNMTNVKDIVSTFITFAIDPKAKLISDELTRKTGTVNDYISGTYFDVDTTAIYHHDIFDISQSIEKLISSGVYSVDGVLKKLGEQPLNTDFSKQHWMTKNYTPIEEALIGDIDVKGGE